LRKVCNDNDYDLINLSFASDIAPFAYTVLMTCIYNPLVSLSILNRRYFQVFQTDIRFLKIHGISGQQFTDAGYNVNVAYANCNHDEMGDRPGEFEYPGLNGACLDG
jgi:hypothetical protein